MLGSKTSVDVTAAALYRVKFPIITDNAYDRDPMADTKLSFKHQKKKKPVEKVGTHSFIIESPRRVVPVHFGNTIRLGISTVYSDGKKKNCISND